MISKLEAGEKLVLLGIDIKYMVWREPLNKRNNAPFDNQRYRTVGCFRHPVILMFLMA